MDFTFMSSTQETRHLVTEFTVIGEPISKARARFTKRGSKLVSYTPQKTLDGEKGIAAAYLSATKRRGTDKEAAYAVHAHFYNGTRQRRDVDNMVKLILDGLNGIAWPDDNQVTEIAARKSYVKKDEARTVVRVYLIGDMGVPKQPCIRCGTEFRTYESWATDPNGKKYCTRDCWYKHSVEKRERTCKHCEKTFLAWGESQEAVYCSRECQSDGMRATLECDNCGTEFTKQKCHVRVKNYCTDECMRLAANRRKTTRFRGTCKVCGSGTTRKEYQRCNPCKLANATVSGKPMPSK